MKTLIKWAVLGVVVAAVLVIARDPQYWRRALILRACGPTVPLWFYEPRERIPGGNQPPAPRESAAAQMLDPTALEAAAAYAEAHHSRALIVSRHGYLVFEKYWQGSSFDTLVDSGPLARIVVALVTGAAISQRRIGWPQEPLGYLIPAWHYDPRGVITVRDLLQLSSGLAPGEPADELGADIVSSYLRRPQADAPGKRWFDQSVDPQLLAYSISRATRQRFAQFVSQTLWERIGAADAWLWLDRPDGAAHIDRGFLVRQGDWMRVAELLLRNGNYQGSEVVAPRWMIQLLQPAATNTDYGSYLRLGMRAERGMTPYAASDVLLLKGGGNRLWVIPSLQIAILRTADAPAAGPGPPGDWDDGRIPNLIVRGARDFVPPAARPGADLSTIVPNH